MLNEPTWVTPDGVIRLNELLLAKTSEPHALLSMDLLVSACEKPKNHRHYNGCNDVAELGTLLLFGIARNHPFAQGNKRTAFTAMIGFLGCNGYRFLVDDDVNCAEHILEILRGEDSEDSFVAALKRAIAPVPAWG